MHKPTFRVFMDAASQWRWRFEAANGRIMATSGEGYSRKHDAGRALTDFLLLSAPRGANGPKIVIEKDRP